LAYSLTGSSITIPGKTECNFLLKLFLKWQDFQEHLPASREPEVMDVAILRIALSQAMVSGLTGQFS
jgi:hypothetical protein